MDALWELICAALPGEGCDCVLARLEKLFGEVAAYTTRSLDNLLLENANWVVKFISPTPTMATLSIRLTKPAGWSLAYLGDILISRLQSRFNEIYGLFDLGLWTENVCRDGGNESGTMRLLSYSRM